MGAATSRLNKGLGSPSPPRHVAKQLLTWETLALLLHSWQFIHWNDFN